MIRKLLLTALCGAVLGAVSASAATVYSLQDGDWNTISTWGVTVGETVVNQIPTAGDLAYIQPGHAVDLGGAGTALHLYVGINWDPGLGVVNVEPGGDLTLVGDDPGGNGVGLSVGFYGTDGTLNVAGGAVTCNQYAIIGENAGTGPSNGTLSVSAGSFATAGAAGHLVVGMSGGNGSVVQTGGDVDVAGELRLGVYGTDTGSSSYQIGGNARLNVAGACHVGYYNDAAFTVVGSSPDIHINGNLVVNRYGGSAAMRFEISKTGIAVINVDDTHWAWFLDGTTFEITGGKVGEVHTLVRTTDTIYAPDSGWVTSSPRYELSVANGGRDLVVTILPCSEEISADLNGDCIVDLADVIIFTANWLSQGVIE